MSVEHLRFRDQSASLIGQDDKPALRPIYGLDLAGTERGLKKNNTTIIGALDPAIRNSEQFAKEQGLISETFFKQDFTHFKEMREKALAHDALPMPEFTKTPPKKYQGSCDDLVRTISPIVNDLLDTMDYNPLHSYEQMIDQMNVDGDVSFRDVKLSSENDVDGSSCAGMSNAIVKAVKSKHANIEGIVGSQHVGHQIFSHAAAIFLCNDGWVLVEPSLSAQSRYFKVPFNQPYVNEADGFSIEASAAQDHTATLTIHGNANYEAPANKTTYHMNVLNADNGVMKNFLTHHGFSPVSAYKPGQKFSYKVIKIDVDQETVIFEDRSKSKLSKDPLTRKKRIFSQDVMNFEDVQDMRFRGKLRTFAGRDFKTKIPVLYRQIHKIVKHKDIFTKAFSEIHRK